MENPKRIIVIFVTIIISLSLLSYGLGWFKKVINPDRAVDTYENFYLMYDQAEQICNDIYVLNSADSISGGFTKTERKIGLENKLNDVIKDYNSKSRAWTKSMWKADDLPYLLKRSDFNCNQ